MAFADAVESHEVRTYLGEVAYLKAVAANSVSAIPAAWLPTAICEEDGRDDPSAGYFGIREWHGFDGYPTAGSAPLSVQLAWEAAYIGAPPDAPGRVSQLLRQPMTRLEPRPAVTPFRRWPSPAPCRSSPAMR